MPIVRWWVVANPRQWTWAELFQSGQIRFRLGKLARHFPRLRVGDLVVGYESSPRRRLVALARVSKPFGVHEENAPPSFELAPVCLFTHGVEYSTIIEDQILAGSEPMRNRNQGTVFELSEVESGHLIDLLSLDTAAQRWLEQQETNLPRESQTRQE